MADDKRILDLVYRAAKLQGRDVVVTSHKHRSMVGVPGWVDQTAGIVVGVAERVHNGPGVTRDLILVQRGSGKLRSVNLGRIIEIREGRS